MRWRRLRRRAGVARSVERSAVGVPRRLRAALKSATSLVLNGQYDAAIPALERLSRERPEDVSLMHQLGLTYVAAGRSSDGVALLEQALKRDPDNLESHLRLATAYINLNDHARALTHAERAVALSPELGRAHVAAGMALWRGGRPLDALSAFERAALRPGHARSALLDGFDPAGARTSG